MFKPQEEDPAVDAGKENKMYCLSLLSITHGILLPNI